MDFIKHDETPLFITAGSRPLEIGKRTPEVLTDVALLCVESEHNLTREVNIKKYSVLLISI